MMVETFVEGRVKPPGRRAWIAGNEHAAGQPLLVFLDGELYLERVGAEAVLDTLQADGRLPPAVAVFVSSESQPARHTDYVCDPGYTRFLEEDLLPFVRGRHRGVDPSRTVLVGLSLSGLAAAYAALTARVWPVVICQSPSLWWEGERLTSGLPRVSTGSPKIWISVGDGETSSGVTHSPSGLFQGVSQLDACRRGADALRAAGYTVEYREFHGGHEAACWRDDLVLALPWATAV